MEDGKWSKESVFFFICLTVLSASCSEQAQNEDVNGSFQESKDKGASVRQNEALSPEKARVMIGDKWGYIDKTGKYVWKPTK